MKSNARFPEDVPKNSGAADLETRSEARARPISEKKYMKNSVTAAAIFT